MAMDNTHTKYLHGSDKRAWNNYAEALKAQKKLDGFISDLKVPELKDGEEYDIPVRRNNNKGK